MKLISVDYEFTNEGKYRLIMDEEESIDDTYEKLEDGYLELLVNRTRDGLKPQY